jgi:hypothetical protein
MNSSFHTIKRPWESLFTPTELVKEVDIKREYKECFITLSNHVIRYLENKVKQNQKIYDKYNDVSNKLFTFYNEIMERNKPCKLGRKCSDMEKCKYKHHDEDIKFWNTRLCIVYDDQYAIDNAKYFGTIDTVSKCLHDEMQEISCIPGVLLEIIHDYVSMPDQYSHCVEKEDPAPKCNICDRLHVPDKKLVGEFYLLNNGKIILGDSKDRHQRLAKHHGHKPIAHKDLCNSSIHYLMTKEGYTDIGAGTNCCDKCEEPVYNWAPPSSEDDPEKVKNYFLSTNHIFLAISDDRLHEVAYELTHLPADVTYTRVEDTCWCR